MIELEFEICKQKLTLTNTDFLVNKSDNYLVLTFDFKSDDWDDKTCYCLLKNSDGDTFQFNILDNEGVVVPDDVLIGGHFEVSCYGATDSERITTNRVVVPLERSGYTGDISSIKGSTDVFLDFEERLRNHTHTIQDIPGLSEEVSETVSEEVGVEIKYALNCVANLIRNGE